MAILFTQPDGSDQHYDTYDEFQQAMILMKRLNGEKVPQDLLDEAKAKFDELNGDKEPKFEVGDEVRVVSAEDGTDSRYHGFRIGSTVKVIEVYGNGKVEAYNGIFYQTLLPHHFEKVEETPTEFRTGDIVRATEDVVGFGGQDVECNAGNLLEVQIGGSGAMCLVKDFWKIAYVSENLANIELVCRKEDRKDIGL